MAVQRVRGARSGALPEARSARRLGAALVGVALGAVAVWSAFGAGIVVEGPLAASDALVDGEPGEPPRPAEALVVGDQRRPAVEPAIVRRVVDLEPEREGPGGRPPRSPAELIALVSNLRSDDVRFNAMQAVSGLRAAGESAVPLLEQALLSRDLQQRQLAGVVLRRLRSAPRGILFEVSVEALRRDMPNVLRKDFELATHATRYLAVHADDVHARRELLRGLGSADEQQCFLCAFLLAQSGCTDWIGRTCGVLIEHLRDNRIDGDAMMSAHGLFRLGQSALPFVRAARARADRQAQRLLDLIELDIENPPRTRAEIAARRSLHDITSLYHDPVFELDLGRVRVATW